MKKYSFLSAILLSSFLVIAQEYRQEIYCKHFLLGYPYGTPSTNDLIIRDIYALSNNDSTKFADWVAYRLDTSMINGPERERNWKADPWLDENETLEPKPDDYKGAYEALKVDKGHQAPLASFDATTTWYETNYLSNITPQSSKLNQGIWKTLESNVRELVNKVEVVYVMTGPLYEKEMSKLPNCNESHVIPSGYWKIISIKNNDSVQSFAFIFDQEVKSNEKLIDHLTTIDEIEKRSNLDFFWLMEDEKEELFEAKKNEKLWSSYFTK